MRIPVTVDHLECCEDCDWGVGRVDGGEGRAGEGDVEAGEAARGGFGVTGDACAGDCDVFGGNVGR
jgi:hypothetical protein